MFTDRINRINPSATLEMTAKASEMRSKGISVINLSVGEPDFNTPKNIINAAKEAIIKGHTKYTPGSGTLELKEAICTKVYRDNKIICNPNNVIVSCGAKHSLYNACQVLFQQNDEVIIFSPYWVSFPDFVSVTGAKPVFVKTNPKKQYEPDFYDLKKKINKKTKGIIINSPSNPTGGVWSNDAIIKTLKIAQKNNLWVFSDECYEQLTYEKSFISIQTLAEEKSKILTFQSCSKTYAMTGWRIGYTIGDQKVIQTMSKLQGQSTSCPNSIAQYAAIEALIGKQNFVKKIKKIFKKRRNLIIKLLNEIPNIICDIPKGAFYVFPSFENYIGKKIKNKIMHTGNDISMLLLKEANIVTVAGDSFGASKNVRFSYAVSEEDIEKAMTKLKEILKNVYE